MILNLTGGRHLFFKRFLSCLLSQLDPALKSFAISVMFVVGLFRSVSGPVWVGEQWFKKKKSHLVLINLLKWSEHFLRESTLPVEIVEAGALPFMQAARCKWMQTHLPKNDHVFKNLGSKVLRARQTWWSFIHRLHCRQRRCQLYLTATPVLMEGIIFLCVRKRARILHSLCRKKLMI